MRSEKREKKADWTSHIFSEWSSECDNKDVREEGKKKRNRKQEKGNGRREKKRKKLNTNFSCMNPFC